MCVNVLMCRWVSEWVSVWVCVYVVGGRKRNGPNGWKVYILRGMVVLKHTSKQANYICRYMHKQNSKIPTYIHSCIHGRCIYICKTCANTQGSTNSSIHTYYLHTSCKHRRYGCNDRLGGHPAHGTGFIFSCPFERHHFWAFLLSGSYLGMCW